MDLKLKDKVALIVGATGDSGLAVTRAFADEGCKLALTSTSPDKLSNLLEELKIPEDRVLPVIMDIREEESVKAGVAAAVERFSTVDVLMTCSGYLPKGESIAESTYEEYERSFAVNFYGCLWAMKYVAPVMTKQHGGAMVLMASNGAFVGGPSLGSYIAAKHALAGLCKSAALELGPQGIRVNYICPGGLDTQMLRRTAAAVFPDKSYEEAKAIWADLYLDKRLCTPEDVANLAVFLASELSSHMQGDAFALDGGLAANRK